MFASIAPAAATIDWTALLTSNAGVILVWMLLFWVVSIPLRNVAIVDLAWGLGFVFVAWNTLWRVAEDESSLVVQHWTLPVLTTLWGLRLSGYLAWRNLGHPEDKRYAAMRVKRPGSFWWLSLVIVFLLQGMVMWVVSLPLQIGMPRAEPRWTAMHALGVLVWLVGWLFETIGDWQLARFKRDPRNFGQVCDRGLWRYTRHPNYFGDFCVWWGLFLLANAWGTAGWTIVSPLIMSVLLMKVSGVTLLEESLQREKPAYADYARRTNAFFPGPPREGAEPQGAEH